MQAYVIWFVAAFILVGAELLAGTFYLLVVGLGLAAGGCVALLGLSTGTQIAVAAFVTVAGIVILRRTRAGAMLRSNKQEVSLDVGQAVQVIERKPDGSLRVNYRGSQWDAEFEAPPALTEASAAAGTTLYIRALRGTRLVVAAQPA